MDKIQEQQIIEGNKLIAEFMGGERHWLNGMKEPFTDDTIWGYYDVGVNIISTYSGRPIALVNDLKYHTSWDWLMPVVEKIESLGYEVLIGKNLYRENSHHCMIHNQGDSIYYELEDSVKIVAVWKTIVEFINLTITQTKNK